MSDDRWGWVTAPASTTPQPPADGIEEKQHFTNSPVPGAGHDALDLWAPAAPATPPGDSYPAPGDDLAYSAVDDSAHRGDIAVGGHGPGDDAPTAQWAAVTPTPAQQDWAEQWAAPTDDRLDRLVVDGRARKARSRSLRRIGIVAAFVAVLAAVIAIGVVVVLPGDDSSAPAAKSAGPAPQGWCASGTNGDTTTVATGGDQKTPVGVIASFVSALIDARSAAAARATMAQTALAPTLDQLQGWITALPPANGWCAQITTTDSASRVLVDLRLHSGADPLQVGHRMTFYLSATTPTAWVIDAIVSDEGSQP
ncbi:hypothetical protein [Williamsia herbipolensis]|uniref:hypothetical protein n=1 Tax=Williamsia herbipolensis TaxID=1603258 RepID=UPI00069692E8|nr:hypothetical protein [Williamsia herbipolensis]